MFGYMTFNVKYYILSQIFYKKIGWLNEKFYYTSAFLKTLVFLSLADVDTPPLLATAQ